MTMASLMTTTTTTTTKHHAQRFRQWQWRQWQALSKHVRGCERMQHFALPGIRPLLSTMATNATFNNNNTDIPHGCAAFFAPYSCLELEPKTDSYGDIHPQRIPKSALDRHHHFYYGYNDEWREPTRTRHSSFLRHQQWHTFATLTTSSSSVDTSNDDYHDDSSKSNLVPPSCDDFSSSATTPTALDIDGDDGDDDDLKVTSEIDSDPEGSWQNMSHETESDGFNIDHDDDALGYQDAFPDQQQNYETIDHVELNKLMEESLKDLKNLMEQTRSVLHQPQTKNEHGGDSSSNSNNPRRTQAMELLETWFALHQEWWHLFSSLSAPSSTWNDLLYRNTANQQQEAAAAAVEKNRFLLVHAMLQACHAVHDLVPFVEPRLAPFFQFFHHSLEQPESLSSSPHPVLLTERKEDETTTLSVNELDQWSSPTISSSSSSSSSSSPLAWQWGICVLQVSAQAFQAYFRQKQEFLSQRRYRRNSYGQDEDPEQSEQDQDPTTTAADRIRFSDLTRLTREMPSRTQSIFEHLHSMFQHLLSEQDSDATTTTTTTVEFEAKQRLRQQEKLLQTAIPHVLQVWACSQEHNRASRADRFFRVHEQYLETDKSQPWASPTVKDVQLQAEVYRILLRAWCLDRQSKQFAFKATGYLMLMEGLLPSDNERRRLSGGARDDNDLYVRIGPSLPDYHMVLKAWTRDQSKNSAKRAHSVIKGLLNYNDKNKNNDDDDDDGRDNDTTQIRPDVQCFSYLLKAAASRPLMDPVELSQLLDDTWKTMVVKLALSPSADCYAAAIRAWKFVALHPDFASKEMELALNQRTTGRDNAVLQVIDLWQTAKRTLKEQQQHRPQYQHKDVSGAYQKDRPHLSTLVYNDVLESLTVWSASTKKKTDLAEDILLEMEQGSSISRTSSAIDEGAGDLAAFRPPRPNPRSYMLVVNIWKSAIRLTNNKHQETLARSKQILWRMADFLKDAESNDMAMTNGEGPRHPKQYTQKRIISQYGRNVLETKLKQESNRAGYPVEVLNAFVELCAQCPIGRINASYGLPLLGTSTIQEPTANNDEHEGLIVFREALSAVESFRRRQQVQPNWDTYAALLYAADRLIPSKQEKQKIVERVFRLACSDGMVEESVLKALMSVTTEEQYRQLVLSKSDLLLDSTGPASLMGGPANGSSAATTSAVVPEEWTRQALGVGRVISLDGRTVRPLSVSGKVTETRAMKEYKMRKLRGKPGQALLRGGRWTEEDEARKQSRANQEQS